MPALSERPLVEGLAAADVVDTLAKSFDHRSHLIDLVSPDPSKVLFGPAATVGFLPVRKDLMDPHLHSLGPAIYRTLGERDPQGHVLVMSSGGHMSPSVGQGSPSRWLYTRSIRPLSSNAAPTSAGSDPSYCTITTITSRWLSTRNWP